MAIGNPIPYSVSSAGGARYLPTFNFGRQLDVQYQLPPLSGYSGDRDEAVNQALSELSEQIRQLREHLQAATAKPQQSVNPYDRYVESLKQQGYNVPEIGSETVIHAQSPDDRNALLEFQNQMARRVGAIGYYDKDKGGFVIRQGQITLPQRQPGMAERMYQERLQSAVETRRAMREGRPVSESAVADMRDTESMLDDLNRFYQEEYTKRAQSMASAAAAQNKSAIDWTKALAQADRASAYRDKVASDAAINAQKVRIAASKLQADIAKAEAQAERRAQTEAEKQQKEVSRQRRRAAANMVRTQLKARNPDMANAVEPLLKSLEDVNDVADEVWSIALRNAEEMSLANEGSKDPAVARKYMADALIAALRQLGYIE